jgi:hypothetical protein
MATARRLGIGGGGGIQKPKPVKRRRRFTVTLQMLENTRRVIEYSLDIRRATNGAHIQMY